MQFAGIFVASTMDRTLWAAGGALNGLDSHVARLYHWPQMGHESTPCELIWEIPAELALQPGAIGISSVPRVVRRGNCLTVS